jgi:hypothetical protein
MKPLVLSGLWDCNCNSWIFWNFPKLLAHIPQSLTCAMLAGILLKFGIQIFSSRNSSGVYPEYAADLSVSKRCFRVTASYSP